MIDTLVHAPNSVTKTYDLADAADAAGLVVRRVAAREDGWVEPARFLTVAGDRTAYRSAGGLLAAAMAAGAAIHLHGAGADWFVALPVEVTGRRWVLVDVAGARGSIATAPTFVKLAEGKFRAFPARRYTAVADLDDVLAQVHADPSLALLATSDWLPIASEYRTFTLGREVVAHSPYLVHDDPWHPLLRTHRASFHDEAAGFVADLLATLPDTDVPPTAVIDVARLDDDRFVVLEVNHAWSSGLYGCDPAAALRAVIAAAEPTDDAGWLWRPDPALAALRR